MREIAIYGKGGIGKSTMTANISAALSLMDRKVLQIGCDPKHDSTQLLMHGKRIRTVLEYLKEENPVNYKISDILFEGYNGVCCLEAGGPEPGVGCAGRGILSTFELLNKLHVKDYAYDYVLYDVLGDVVCGGFAVPIRREYADEIYIVTSGEFMAIYAANNILRGIKNFDGTSNSRIGGIILNSRNLPDEDERVNSFAKAVKLPIIAVIPRSNEFAEAEKMGCTLVEKYIDSPIRKKFISLAEDIIKGGKLYLANPMTEEDLEKTILNRKIVKEEKKTINLPSTRKVENKIKEKQPLYGYMSKNIISKEPLHGCAFNGAVSMSVQVKDAVIIGHGPKSCSHIAYQSIASAGRRSLYEKGQVLPVQSAPNLVSSDMDDPVMIFGGMDLLEDKINKVSSNNPSAIIVVSSCPSGIIGDDIEKIEEKSTDEMPIIPIVADGNLTGDYLQGMIMSYTILAEKLIDRSVPEETDCVNIIFEKVVAKNTHSNFEIIKGLLDKLGISINCRYLTETTVEEIRKFQKAPLNLLANKDYMGRLLEDFFTKEFNSSFLEYPFPVGCFETERWLKEIAVYFDRESLVEDILERERRIYDEEVARLRPYLKGRKLMIITYNHNVDWILEAVLALEMEVVKIGILNFSQDNIYVTKYDGQFFVEEKYDQSNRKRDLEMLKPDILLSNYTSADLDGSIFTDTIPHCPDVGFMSGIELAKRWTNLFQFNIKEGWKKDDVFFKKYNSR